MTAPQKEPAGSEREAFEAHASKRALRLDRDDGEGYRYIQTDEAWAAWQARASQPSGAAGEVDLDGRLPDRLEFSNRIPENVMAALNRMCSPLDPTRLTGFTAEQDAKCMALIRSYLLGEEVPAGSKDSHD